ncbi:MAG: hypothetical protein MK161_13840 [Pirellulales bacterium]|nr:hypothetical protein [Pirellulales bacterium]
MRHALRRRCENVARTGSVGEWVGNREAGIHGGRSFHRRPGYLSGSSYFNDGTTVIKIDAYFGLCFTPLTRQQRRLAMVTFHGSLPL